FISGLGLYRRAAFAHSTPTPLDKYYGLEEWQVRQGPGLVRGWITPALPVFLLDRCPLAPWREYATTYSERGWQRVWPKYDPACTFRSSAWTVAPGPPGRTTPPPTRGGAANVPGPSMPRPPHCGTGPAP